jgi:hypothetical protein
MENAGSPVLRQKRTHQIFTSGFPSPTREVRLIKISPWKSRAVLDRFGTDFSAPARRRRTAGEFSKKAVLF